jgi:hypothetical protein
VPLQGGSRNSSIARADGCRDPSLHGRRLPAIVIDDAHFEAMTGSASTLLPNVGGRYLGVKLGIIVLLVAGAMLAITTALSTRGRAAAWDEAVTHPAPPTTAPATR